MTSRQSSATDKGEKMSAFMKAAAQYEDNVIAAKDLIRLQDAAPDLLAALETILEHVDNIHNPCSTACADDDEFCEKYEAARAAVAKATGDDR